MKKYLKYLFTLLISFFVCVGAVSANTIIETTEENDGYDTIEAGSIFIGVTRFNSEFIITGPRAAKAGSNDAVVYAKMHGGSFDSYDAPAVYVYAGSVGGWYVLDDEGGASEVTDAAVLNELNNQEVYFVDNVEKIIEVDVTGKNIDPNSLPEGVTLDGDTLLVPSTAGYVEVTNEDGEKVGYGMTPEGYQEDSSKFFRASEGFITGYDSSYAAPDRIPDWMDGDEIIGVRSNALAGSGITSIRVPHSIVNLEDNAFAGLELEELIFEEKYDERDFATLGENAFGGATPIYENDLTEILSHFEDEVEVQVRNGFELDEYDGMYNIPSLIQHNEFKRLGIEFDDEYQGLVDGYSIYYTFQYDHETGAPDFDHLILSVSNNDREVHKDIAYEITYVDTTDTNYSKIAEEYEEYFEGLADEFETKNHKIKVTGFDKIDELAKKYGYELDNVGWGDGGMPPEAANELSLQESGARVLIIKDGILYNIYDFDYYGEILYKMNLEGEFDDYEALGYAMLDEFETLTGVKRGKDDVVNSYTSPETEGLSLYVTVEDDYENTWTLISSMPVEPGSVIDTGEYEEYGTSTRVLQKAFYPATDPTGYSTPTEYKEAIIEELRGIEELGDNLTITELQQWNSSKEPNADGKYESTYYFSVHDRKEDMRVVYEIKFKFCFDNAYSEEFYYVDLAHDFGTQELMRRVAINRVINENNITNYEISQGERGVQKIDDEYSYYNGMPENAEYFGSGVMDYTHNKRWIVVYPKTTQTSYSNVYRANISGDFETVDEIYEAMLADFEEVTGFTNYEITGQYTDGENASGIKYRISVKIDDTLYITIEYTIPYVVGQLNEYVSPYDYTVYVYVPEINYADYYGNTNEYIDLIVNQVKEMENLEGVSNLSVDTGHNEYLIDGTQNVTFAISFYGNDKHYESFFTRNYSNVNDEVVVIDELYPDNTYAEANELAYNSVITSKGLTDYYKSTSDSNVSKYYRDVETGEYVYYQNAQTNGEQEFLYHRLTLIDFATGSKITIYRRISE